MRHQIESRISGISLEEHDNPALKQLLESPEWKNLRPNYSRPDALPPQQITYELIDTVVNLLLEERVQKTQEGSRKDEETAKILSAFTESLGKHGNLTYIGQGQDKTCYLLTTPEGKKLAIKYGPYEHKLVIPQDPKIFQTSSSNIYRQAFEYSDLRTYLIVPIQGNITVDDGIFCGDGIQFQEYGGNNILSILTDPFSLRKQKAIARMSNHMKDGISFIDTGELDHERHYLDQKPFVDDVAIFDIPLTRRISRPH